MFFFDVVAGLQSFFTNKSEFLIINESFIEQKLLT